GGDFRNHEGHHPRRPRGRPPGGRERERESHHEPPASRQQNLLDLKAAVKRDLEWLLNTRQMIGGVPEELKETSNSVAAYGLPDFTTINLKSEVDRTVMRRAIETAISVFEPRLEDVIVIIAERRRNELVMRFRIDARLKVEPAPESITFDTTLQLDSGQYSVKEG